MTNLRWIGEADYDRVAETRLRCYAPASKDAAKFRSDIPADKRGVPGDYLLIEQDGRPIATTTSLSMHMWVRGARLPCQGVAYVGTIRTARRGGIAAQLMKETLDKAREREQAVSALMPFRASFYEKFGYGFAERRTGWTIPLALLPSVDTAGMRYATAADRPAIAALRQRFVERGQCDIETSPGGWVVREQGEGDGFQIVDEIDGTVRGWIFFAGETVVEGRATTLGIRAAAWDTPAHLLRLLSFCGGQRDQFAIGTMHLPSDFPLNRLLRETQIPHRPVSHGCAEAKPYTRMQMRILNHKNFLELLKLPDATAGSFSLAVQECEGEISRLRVDIDRGHITTKPFAGDCDFACPDRIWSSIATGDVTARTTVDLGLATCTDAATVALLDAFADGPAPFCNEYF